jgi:phytanoyl-CoA hydroxylase
MLNHKQLEQYHSEGFTVVPFFIDSDQIQKFIGKIDAISKGNTLSAHDATRMEMEPEQEENRTKIRRLYEPCTHYPVFQEYAESKKLLDCVEQLIGPNIICHYSKLNMKPAKIGAVVDWHQDLSYYPLTNRDSLAVLLYLDDTGVENGGLKILPGMHTESLMDHTDGKLFQGRITEELDESAAVNIEGPAGTAIFMHCMAPHASNLNQSDKPRRTLIVSYRAADAYPLYLMNRTDATEKYARLVRGSEVYRARFTMDEFPIPRYKDNIISLYQLQERSRTNTL